jgi:hypothetical protein
MSSYRFWERHWRATVGAEVAANAKLLDVVQDTLIIECKNDKWSAQLRYNTDQIVAALPKQPRPIKYLKIITKGASHLSNTPIGDGLSERMTFLIQASERIAAMQERTEIIKILTDELSWQEKKTDNQEVWECLYRVTRAIEARHKAQVQANK